MGECLSLGLNYPKTGVEYHAHNREIKRVDGFFYTLLAFTIVDFITGLMAAWVNKELSSSVGYKGICRKIAIFILVGIAHIVDAYLIGAGSILRNAVIFFYLANEGISILENAGKLGLPIPEYLKQALVQLKDKADDSAAELKDNFTDRDWEDK